MSPELIWVIGVSVSSAVFHLGVHHNQQKQNITRLDKITEMLEKLDHEKLDKTLWEQNNHHVEARIEHAHSRIGEHATRNAATAAQLRDDLARNTRRGV